MFRTVPSKSWLDNWCSDILVLFHIFLKCRPGCHIHVTVHSLISHDLTRSSVVHNCGGLFGSTFAGIVCFTQVPKLAQCCWCRHWVLSLQENMHKSASSPTAFAVWTGPKIFFFKWLPFLMHLVQWCWLRIPFCAFHFYFSFCERE